jgi:hypothetical protein
MRYLYSLVLILYPITSIYCETIIDGGYISGVWATDGNPYILTGTIMIGIEDTLIIESGVIVLLYPRVGIYIENGTLLAYGAVDDSIYFHPAQGRDWGGIVALGRERRSVLEFEYCSFRQVSPSYEQNGAITCIPARELSLKNCSMIDIHGEGVKFNGFVLRIEECYFSSIAFNCIESLIFDGGEPVMIRRSCFDPGDFDWIRLGIYGVGGKFEQNMVVSCDFHAGRNTNVINSIFINSLTTCFVGGDPNPGYIHHNIYFGRDNFFTGDTVEGLSVHSNVNANGDSTDIYGNLFLDPFLAGGEDFPDRFFLSDSSPCIDAGDPDSPLDPDSTIADIGPFFFSQPNIAVSVDSFSFAETPVGSTDTLFFSIRNRGDQRELRYFIDEESMNLAFSALDWLGDTMTVAAGESVQLGLMFRPDSAREYFDTLRIHSNDRDEGVISIPVRGVAPEGVDEFRIMNLEFEIEEAYPNPFNSSTTITFSLSALYASSTVNLAVFDQQGRHLKRLVNGPYAAGEHSVVWDAGDLGSGIYLVRLEAGGQNATKKVVLMR